MWFSFLTARNFAASRYIYISKPPMNWSDAQSYCRQHYTDLAIIKNSIESVAFQNILTTSAWLGLFRDSWKWINETNMSTVMWAPGQPDNRNDHEDCGFVTNGQAADAPCSDTKPFFCYSGELKLYLVSYSLPTSLKLLFKCKLYLLYVCVSGSRYHRKKTNHKSEDPVQTGCKRSCVQGGHLRESKSHPLKPCF